MKKIIFHPLIGKKPVFGNLIDVFNKVATNRFFPKHAHSITTIFNLIIAPRNLIQDSFEKINYIAWTRMLTVAYGEATLDRSNVYRWYKMFSEGREDVNDEERAGRPSTSTTDENIDKVKKIVLANRRITVREVAEDLNISIGSCHSIFTNDLGMKRVAAKFVPKLLNFDQKQHRINVASVQGSFTICHSQHSECVRALNFVFHTKFDTDSLIHFLE